jgi:gliding motility-associated-like protein
MKKLLLVPVFMLFCVILKGQLIYYLRPDLQTFESYFGVFDVATCTDSIIFPINLAPEMGVVDLAVCPDGNFYVTISNDNFPFYQMGRLNLQDSSVVVLGDLVNGPVGNSLVCDGAGVLWMGPPLNSYDPYTGVETYYGYIGYSLAGDMTYRNGKLYGTTFGNELVEIDPNNLSATHVVYTYPLTGVVAYGVASFPESCDSTTTYISTTNFTGNPYTSVDSVNGIYAIDPINQTTTLVCTPPHYFAGTASASEFLASNCTLHLDLDADNSSGAIGDDWHAPILCSGNTLPVADSDATWYSGYPTDSMRVHLLAPAPDAPFEYFTAAPFGSVSVAGQGTAWLSLNSQANTAIPVSNIDFQTVVRSLRWHDDAMPVTPGIRTVEVVVFGAGGRRDTAYAFLEAPSLLSAGIDTAFTVCEGAPAFGLFAPGGANGGAWSPTALGGGFFSPVLDQPGVFSYSVNNGNCPADTAAITVSVLSRPIFSLGQDTAVCSGQSLTLSAPGNAHWQDGTNSSGFNVGAPGLFWAEYTGGNGCLFRDSITVEFKQAVQAQTTMQPCAGQPFVWNGQSFLTDTTVCATFSAFNGCDSVHCLSLAFYYPSISLDTAICSGQTLQWFGVNYVESGIYLDTVFNNGCLMAAQLSLAVSPPDSIFQPVSICAGDAYVVGNQSFSTSGQYSIPLQTALGCDSIIILDLNVTTAVETSFSATICPGETYPFDGQVIAQPGMYVALFQTANGCDSTVHLSLSEFPQPAVQITGDTMLCSGEMATFSAGNFNSYKWSGGESTAAIVVANAGMYSLTVTDANGCSASDNIDLVVLPEIEVEWQATDPSCHGVADGAIDFVGASGAIEPLQFSLNGDLPSLSGSFEHLTSGPQNILVTDALGCSKLFELELLEPVLLAVDLGPSQTLDIGDTYSIPVQINQTGIFNYSWWPPDGLSCTGCPNPVLTATDSIIYALLLTNNAGCTASDSLLILIRKGEWVYIPQIFAPNRDSPNNSFTIYGDPSLVASVDEFQIYDRWGEMVFARTTMSINEESSGWDGRSRGRPVLPGVYVWFAKIRMLDGTILFKKGDVTVVR